MRKPAVIVSCFVLLNIRSFSQDISGKWYGKLSQGPNDGYSRLYDLELSLKQKDNSIRGESYSYIPGEMDWRIGLTGSINHGDVYLKEHRLMIREEKMPDPTWHSCVKTLTLTYRKEGNREYLQGDWSGKGTDDGEPCEPGSIILSRTKEDIQPFFDKGGFSNPVAMANLAAPALPVFTADFNNTGINNITEIEVSHLLIQIRLYDYLRIDDDTVSVYLNRSLLARNIRVSKEAVKLDLKLDTRLDTNEILLYAENLGSVPSNTSLLEIIDGRHKYRMKIESDKQKTAAIYLRYNPEK